MPKATDVVVANSPTQTPPSSPQQMEPPGLHDHSKKNEPKKTPLPLHQFVPLAFVLLSESLCGTMITPFIGLLVAHLQNWNPDQAGYASGMMVGVFALGQLCSSKTWGWISDEYGRRFPLVSGLFTTGLMILGFGLSGNIWFCAVFRFGQGLFNGNMLVAKTMIADITDKTNEAQGFSFTSLCSAVGFLIGPTLGGLLYDPCTQDWLQWANFNPEGIFGTRPAFLPCLVIFGYTFVGMLACTFFVQESNPNAKPLPAILKTLYPCMWRPAKPFVPARIPTGSDDDDDQSSDEGDVVIHDDDGGAAAAVTRPFPAGNTDSSDADYNGVPVVTEDTRLFNSSFMEESLVLTTVTDLKPSKCHRHRHRHCRRDGSAGARDVSRHSREGQGEAPDGADERRQRHHHGHGHGGCRGGSDSRRKENVSPDTSAAADANAPQDARDAAEDGATTTTAPPSTVAAPGRSNPLYDADEGLGQNISGGSRKHGSQRASALSSGRMTTASSGTSFDTKTEFSSVSSSFASSNAARDEAPTTTTPPNSCVTQRGDKVVARADVPPSPAASTTTMLVVAPSDPTAAPVVIEEEHYEKFGYKQAFTRPYTRKMLTQYMILVAADNTAQQLFPLWCITTDAAGGLGMTSAQVGRFLLFNSIPLFCSNFCFHKVVPHYANKIGLFRIAVTLAGLAVAVMPFMYYLPGSWATYITTFLCYSTRQFFCTWCYSLNTMLTARSAPPGFVGAIMGINQSCGAAMRAVMPFISSPVYAWSVSGNHPIPFNHVFGFVLAGLGYFLAAYRSYSIRTNADGRLELV